MTTTSSPGGAKHILGIQAQRLLDSEVRVEEEIEQRSGDDEAVAERPLPNQARDTEGARVTGPLRGGLQPAA